MIIRISVTVHQYTIYTSNNRTIELLKHRGPLWTNDPSNVFYEWSHNYNWSIKAFLVDQ